MGMELLDISFQIERRFGISISHVDWLGIATVGDLAALVAARYPKIAGDVCPGSRAFHTVRDQVLVVAREHGIQIDPRAIRPSAGITDAFGSQWRRLWRRMELVNERWPPLIISNSAAAILNFATIVMVVPAVAALFLAGTYSPIAGWGVALAGAIVGCVSYTVIRQSLSRRLPDGIATMRELVHVVAPPVLQSGAEGSARVLMEVREIVAESLSLPVEKVLPQSRFIEDLNAG